MFIPRTQKPPTAKEPGTIADFKYARVCLGSLMSMEKTVKSLLYFGELLCLSLDWLRSYVKTELLRASDKCYNLKGSVEEKQDQLNTTTEMTTSNCNDFMQLREKFTQLETQILYEHPKVLHELIRSELAEPQNIVDIRNSEEIQKKFEAYVKSCWDVCKLFEQDKKQMANRFTNEHFKLLHNNKRKQLVDVCDEAVTVFRKDFMLSCKKLYSDQKLKLGKMNEIRVKLTDLNLQIDEWKENFAHLSTEIEEKI